MSAPAIALPRRVAAEAAGTAFLLAAVVGSGIMAERLFAGAPGADGLALLANSIATAGALLALILAFGRVSGAHLNPAVTLALAASGRAPARTLAPYLAAQVAGAVLGVWAAHAMFGAPVLQWGVKARLGAPLWFAEAVATVGLVLVVLATAARGAGTAAPAVAGYILGAYWFTASTSFANPAVTIARALTDSFAGIRPADAPAFVAAQLAGAAAASLFWRWLRAEAEEA
ncbi:MAG: aquaporin [Alphaproteobacteria bacterium]|nr:aquaporin [Alphaproteobacteria bacterium]